MDFGRGGSNHQYIIKVLTGQMEYRVYCNSFTALFGIFC